MKINECIGFVTGGASGLGEATVRRLVNKGAKVGFMDLSEEAGKRIEEELGDSVIFTQGNVTCSEDIENAVNRTVEKFGKINILGNMAGIVYPKQIISKKGVRPLEEYKKVIDIDLIGTLDTLRLVANIMAKNEPAEDGERGVIINVASTAAFEGQKGQPAYSAAKGGVVSLTLPIAREFETWGIRCVSIAPGYMKTAIFDNMSQEVIDGFDSDLVFPHRFGKPYEEFAFLFEHIVENPYINGCTLRIDAAQRM